MDTYRIFPRWLNELKRFQSLKSEFFLYGNVYDCYYFPMNYATVADEKSLEYAKFNDIEELLEQYLLSQGFELISYFDVIDGITFRSADNSLNETNVLSRMHVQNTSAESHLKNAKAKKLEDAISFYRELISNPAMLSAGIINFASRFTSNPNALEEEAKPVFLKILKAAQESKVFPHKNDMRNIIIFICDKLNDIPAWILLENPLTKGIEVQKPNREERLRFFQQRSKQFFIEGEDPDYEETSKSFPDLTENFTNRELENLISISKQEKLHINKQKEIIDLYKYGVRENPWESIDLQKIRNAERELGERVLGQSKAINKAVEIIRRANLGLDSIDKPKPTGKPKGVLFFAGPTGTGKTELAKSLAELIFGDEEAMIRFDMSEYNDGNSDVKLIGSPPGYVGYEEGGQLTDAIRRKPFSIVLFDEIEKAHPRIFDKFLQILDDGRLTDGKGETAYFSQSLIIFTSNLGIYKDDGEGGKMHNIQISDSYESVEQKLNSEIRNFFGSTLGRPEVFNRFGDNFVVFDFIRPDVAVEIIRKNLNVIKNNLSKLRNISFDFDDEFISKFLKTCAYDNLEMGGRGIVNRIETHIKNGLTNHMFRTGKTKDCTVRANITENTVIFS